jgi:hypothetical protein
MIFFLYICFIMKSLIILLMLLGVTTLEGKPTYRIQTWTYEGTTYYLPQQKIWYRTNYFPLPFKVWKSGSYPFQNKYQAEEIIQNWKDSHLKKLEYKRSRFYEVE